LASRQLSWYPQSGTRASGLCKYLADGDESAVRVDLTIFETSQEEPMGRLGRVLFFALMMLVPGAASAGPAEDVQAALDKWVAMFNANDVDALVKLYTPDAVLVGQGGSTLNQGSDAIRKFYSQLEKSGDKVEVGVHKVVVLDDKVAYVTGFDEFTATRNGETVQAPAGFTMVLVKNGDQWLIAHQHSSRRTPTQGG
jgi:uncharacterized protein (TIGR02246 family)